MNQSKYHKAGHQLRVSPSVVQAKQAARLYFLKGPARLSLA